jgi:hypothetical protein
MMITLLLAVILLFLLGVAGILLLAWLFYELGSGSDDNRNYYYDESDTTLDETAQVIALKYDTEARLANIILEIDHTEK